MAPKRPKKDENHYFLIVFEDGSEATWGFHPAELRGDHMGRQFAREKEIGEAKMDRREPRQIKNVTRLMRYP